MAKLTAAQDEFSISMITMGDTTFTAGTLKANVVGVLGTRDVDGTFSWGEKIGLEIYPDVPGEFPLDIETGEVMAHIRLVPEDILLDMRAALIALEDFLQTEVDEPNSPMPNTVAQARTRYEGKDPRILRGWRTLDGHNSAPGHQKVPKPKDRIVGL